MPPLRSRLCGNAESEGAPGAPSFVLPSTISEQVSSRANQNLDLERKSRAASDDGIQFSMAVLPVFVCPALSERNPARRYPNQCPWRGVRSDGFFVIPYRH